MSGLIAFTGAAGAGVVKPARAHAPASGQPNLRAVAAARDPIVKTRFLRHAVGVLETADDVDSTLGDLSAAGIGPSVVSLTAPLQFSGTVRGELLGDWVELGARSRAGARLACRGPLSEALLRLCAREEAAIDTLLARWLPSANADFLAEQLDLGRGLLWVHLHSADDERLACRVLLGNSRHGVQVHDLPAVT